MKHPKRRNSSPNEPCLPDSGRERKARRFDTLLVIRLMQRSPQRHRYTIAHIRALPANAINCDLDAIAVRSGCLQRKAFDANGFLRHRCAL